MQRISPQAEARLSSGVQKFQPILRRAQLAGRNESDTVMIITDILCEVFGYDKYENITSELCIKQQFCDLAVQLKGKVRLLLECKAVGIALRDVHVSNATGYAASAGIDWVVLTNGITWRIYQVLFGKPVETVLVCEFNFCELNVNRPEDYAPLYALSIEAFQEEGNIALSQLYAQRRVLNRFIVGQVLLNDWMIGTIRRSLERHYPGVKMSDSDVRRILQEEVFRHEIVEGPQAEDARRDVDAANARMQAAQKERRK